MDMSAEARTFTETLLSAVRLQRHLGVRVIISTQEPTISTALLNLCSVTIVHRFTSPEWLHILRKHLAAAADDRFTPRSESGTIQTKTQCLLSMIVQLRVGEAILFAPTAIVGSSVRNDGVIVVRRLGHEYLTIKVRSRLTADGGRSVLSS
jgi:hypothetical protein